MSQYIVHLQSGERAINAAAARESIIGAALAILNAEPEEVREARRVRYERFRYRNHLRILRYTRGHIHNGRKPTARRKR